MRKIRRQREQIDSDDRLSTKQTDTSGNPSESYDWGHMAAVRQEWQHQFSEPYVNVLEPTVAEITSTEMWVRKELYPSPDFDASPAFEAGGEFL